MSNYAIINSNGVVVNTVVWNGSAEHTIPDGCTTQLLTSGVDIGWTYANGVFVAPTPPTPPALTATQLAIAALSAGLTIESTSTPAINGTYSLSITAQNNLTAVAAYIGMNNLFPGGNSTMVYVDQNNDAHVFPSTTVFKAFATAVADYVAAITLYQLSNGAYGSLPVNSITIP